MTVLTHVKSLQQSLATQADAAFLRLQELSEVQQHKAHHLFRWARDAGKAVSRDEVADMVRRHVSWYMQHVSCFSTGDCGRREELVSVL